MGIDLKATLLALTASVAAIFSAVGEQIDGFDALSGLMERGGVLLILAWFLWYVTCRRDPRVAKDFRELHETALRQAKEAREALQAQAEQFRLTVSDMVHKCKRRNDGWEA